MPTSNRGRFARNMNRTVITTAAIAIVRAHSRRTCSFLVDLVFLGFVVRLYVLFIANVIVHGIPRRRDDPMRVPRHKVPFRYRVSTDRTIPELPSTSGTLSIRTDEDCSMFTPGRDFQHGSLFVVPRGNTSSSARESTNGIGIIRNILA